MGRSRLSMLLGFALRIPPFNLLRRRFRWCLVGGNALMPVRPSPRTIAAEIHDALRAAADPKAAAQGQTYFKEAVTLMGVRAQEMRRIARETYQQVKPHWTLKEALALCEILLPNPRLEVKGVAIVVCERFGREFDPRLLPTVQDWIDRGACDSWA